MFRCVIAAGGRAWQRESILSRDEILERLRERILSFAASRVSRELAEDLAQETMMVLHEKYGQVEAMEDLVPLSFQIVRFKLFAAVRKSARRGEVHSVPAEEANLTSGNPGPEEALLQSERRRVLLDAVRNLGTRCRELLRMKLEGHSFEAIRAHFGAASMNTVYTWDLRCRRQLIEALAGLGETVR